MKIEKAGIALKPRKFQGWRVEITGGTEEHQGFHAHFSPPFASDTVTFWAPTLDELEEQLADNRLDIYWLDE